MMSDGAFAAFRRRRIIAWAGVFFEIDAGGIGVAPYLASDRRPVFAQDFRDLSAALAARAETTNDLAFCQQQVRKFGFQTS
jgi:hypothetical protein